MKAAEVLEDYDEGRWLDALDWHALRCAANGLTPQQEDAWRHWSMDPENRRIYAVCARLYRDAQGLEESPTVVRLEGARNPGRFRGIGSAVRWAVALTTLVACAASSTLVLPNARTVSPRIASARTGDPFTTYRSSSGQTRRIRLRDGSTVVLGARTVLEVAISARRRRLDLERGEAWFDVVHRPHWPFIVTAGPEVIRDLGTAFVVDREAGRTEVTVTQGQVEVSLTGAASTPNLGGAVLKPIRLQRGERFVYGRRIPAALRYVSPRLALDWTTGRLEFLDEPLGAVAENLSRYSQEPILVAPAAATLQITTLVLSHHIRAWIAGLSRVLPVVAVRAHHAVCIRLRTQSPTQTGNECHGS